MVDIERGVTREAAPADAGEANAGSAVLATPEELDRCARTVYFARVPPCVPLEEVRELFSSCGPLVEVNLFRPWCTAKTSKGCGLVEYQHVNGAEKALATLNGLQFWPEAFSPLLVEQMALSKCRKHKALVSAATAAASAGAPAAESSFDLNGRVWLAPAAGVGPSHQALLSAALAAAQSANSTSSSYTDLGRPGQMYPVSESLHSLSSSAGAARRSGGSTSSASHSCPSNVRLSDSHSVDAHSGCNHVSTPAGSQAQQGYRSGMRRFPHTGKPLSVSDQFAGVHHQLPPRLPAQHRSASSNSGPAASLSSLFHPMGQVPDVRPIVLPGGSRHPAASRAVHGGFDRADMGRCRSASARMPAAAAPMTMEVLLQRYQMEVAQQQLAAGALAEAEARASAEHRSGAMLSGEHSEAAAGFHVQGLPPALLQHSAHMGYLDELVDGSTAPAGSWDTSEPVHVAGLLGDQSTTSLALQPTQSRAPCPEDSSPSLLSEYISLGMSLRSDSLGANPSPADASSLLLGPNGRLDSRGSLPGRSPSSAGMPQRDSPNLLHAPTLPTFDPVSPPPGWQQPQGEGYMEHALGASLARLPEQLAGPRPFSVGSSSGMVPPAVPGRRLGHAQDARFDLSAAISRGGFPTAPSSGTEQGNGSEAVRLGSAAAAPVMPSLQGMGQHMRLEVKLTVQQALGLAHHSTVLRSVTGAQVQLSAQDGGLVLMTIEGNSQQVWSAMQCAQLLG